jgi:PD-(D/E)XK nuclease superfamily
MNEALKSMLARLRGIATPKRERTFFDIGGRGYYENPTSDLLAFFLQPAEAHGLKSLFLGAFLECLGQDPLRFAMQAVSVSREVELSEGRLDLLVRGSGWCLIIENKVYHHQVNPFDSYAAYGKSLIGAEPLLAVLSPNGTTEQAAWNGVSYKCYCQLLHRRLNEADTSEVPSKWLLFAREFIQHLENELYSPVMKSDQIAFVEENAQQIEEARQLFERYQKFLIQYLPAELEKVVSGVRFSAWDDRWAIRCRADTWGHSNIAYWYEQKTDGWIRQISVYLVNLSDDQKAVAQREFRDKSGMQHWTEGKWSAWRTLVGYRDREAAVVEMGRLAAIISGLFREPESPARPDSAASGQTEVNDLAE